MKKNVLMRAASGLLVATMLTTCAISGTFAKYVTQDNGGDMARVAKWGVVVQVEGDLYGQKYLNAAGGNTVTNADGDTVGVDGQQIAPPTVVAPGSKSDDPFTFSINGKPEVDSQTTIKIKAQNIYLNEGEYGVMVPVETGVVTVANFADLTDNGLNNAGVDITATQYNGLWVQNVDGSYSRATTYTEGEQYFTLEDYVDNDAIYYPVVYNMVGSNGTTVTDTDASNDGPANKSADTLKNVAETILKAVKNDTVSWENDGTDATVYSATVTSAVTENNKDLAEVFKLAGQSITWNWEFEDVVSVFTDMQEYTGYGISQQDKLDTILGNLMAERDHKIPTEQTTFPDGEVVKLISGSNVDTWNWKAPTEATTSEAGVTNNDFELDTMFDIDILVEQVD